MSTPPPAVPTAANLDPAGGTAAHFDPAAAVAAYFDVDGTIARSNIVRYYVHFRTRGMSRLRRAVWIAAYLPQVVRWLVLDQFDRRRMNELFYRGYRGLALDDLTRWSAEDHQEILGRHVFPEAAERIARHRVAGTRVVLVSGSLDFILEPLARSLNADDLIAVEMETSRGALTGRIAGEPLAGDAKVRAVRNHADRHRIELSKSWAYGDSIADAPVLELVGHPVAVNADRKLARLARARGWEIADWRP